MDLTNAFVALAYLIIGVAGSIAVIQWFLTASLLLASSVALWLTWLISP